MTSRQELKEHEFYENFALLPRKDGNVKKPRSTTEPVQRLIDSMDVRRERNILREEETAAAEARSAFLKPELILERTIAAGEAKINAAYEEVLVRTTMAGDHIFKDVRTEALASTDQEGEWYAEAAQQIKDSEEMRAFGPNEARRMVIPKDSKEHELEQQNRREYVEFMADRLEAAGNARRLHNDIRTLVHHINDAEDEVGEILFEVDEYKLEHDFDWQLEKQTRVRVLRESIAKDKAQLFSSDKQLAEIVEAVHTRFPDLKESVQAPEGGANSKLISAEASGANDISCAYGWIMGRLTVDGKVCNIFYGQFTESQEPPVNGWMFLGRNIDQSLRNAKPPPLPATDTLDDNSSLGSQSRTGQRPPGSPGPAFPETPGSPGSPGGEVPSTATEGKTGGNRVQLLEEEMLTCIDDIILCSPAKVDVNKSISARTASDDFFRISGCSIGQLNGRYLEWGTSCGARQYRNVKGWVLFRTKLHEIPELGIYVDGCYNAFRGPSVTELLKRRADVAYKELLIFGSGIDEGTAKFKRRFAEISRSGTKMITADQTEVLARTDAVRAKVRNKANADMLDIIQATGGGHAPEEETNETEEETEARIKEDPRKAAQDLIKTRAFNALGTVSLVAEASDQEILDDAMLEVRVTMAKNTNFQKGSQAYQVSKKKDFLAQEAELAREAVSRIEVRESLVRRTKLDNAWVQKQYLESEWDGSAAKGTPEQNQALTDLLLSMKAVRMASIDVLEAIGAWTRFTKLQREAVAANVDGGSKYGLNTHGNREYCVVIAAKGPQLYPISHGITSGARRFRRGQETPKIAVITKYIGKYADKQDGMDAFGMACAAVPIEQRPFAYADNPPMFIGMRKCRKHYLIRSEGVPSDLPCEVCASGEFSKANSVVRGATMDNKPQFIWHGGDYVEQMLEDMMFLEDNIPLGRRIPELKVKGNPFLLVNDTLGQTLATIDGKPKDAFNMLRGREEQVKDAIATGQQIANIPVVLPPTNTETAYTQRTVWERQIMDRTGEGMASPGSTTSHSSETPSGGVAKSPGMDYTVLSTLRKSTMDGTDTMAMTMDRHPEIELDGFMEPASPRTPRQPPLPPGSPADRAQRPPTQPMTRVAFVDTSKCDVMEETKSSGSLLAPDDDEISMDRLHRALAIMYQSTKFSKDQLDDSVLPPSVRATALMRRPLERPDLDKNKSSLQRFMEKQEKLEVLPEGTDFIPTETKYTYRGAVLATTQMRPPLAGRDPSMWCRGDEGEWASLSKGRSVRSWEFQDKLLYDGRRRAAERKALQEAIRKAISVRVVDADVPRIEKLCFEASNVRGNVLNLDVIQAQTYLTYRKKVIAASCVVSAIYRALKIRRVFREMVAKAIFERDKFRQTQIESVNKAMDVVAHCIGKGLENVKHSLCQWDFVGVVNANGVNGVASLHQMPRGLHHSKFLCPSCSGQSTTILFNHITGESHKVRGACTCRYVQGPERWFVRLYDPLSRSSINTIVSEATVRAAITRINNLTKETLEQRCAKLVGKNFDVLRLLFQDMEGASNLVMMQHAIGKLASAREGSLLPLLPSWVDQMLLTAIEYPHTSPAEALVQLAQTNYYTGHGPMTVFDVEAHGNEMEQNKYNWQPFADLRRAKRQMEAADHHCTQLGFRIAKSEDDHRDGIIRLGGLILQLEQEQTAYEDARMKYLNACDAYDTHVKHLAATMAFQKRNREHFDALLTGDDVDMDGIRDDFMDGNAYQGLNMDKRLKKIIRETRENMNVAYITQSKTVVVRAAQQMDLHDLHEFVVEHKAELVVYRPVLPYLQTVVDYCVEMVKHAGNVFVKNFVVPRLPGRKGRRQLRTRNTDLVYVRDPIVRAKVEYRANWIYISTRVMSVSPWKGPCNTGASLKTSVSYYIDPVTDYHLLVLGATDMSGFEEALMHKELYFTHTTFTELNGVTPYNETLLRPSDVRELMARKTATHKKRRGEDPSSVTVVQTRKERLAAMEKGFNRRRLKQTELDFEMAEAVLDQLHLQWYTHRPCLGMLHFERRQLFCHTTIRRSLWFRDNAKGSSSTPPPKVYHEQCFVAGKLTEVIIRTSWGEIDVNISLNGIIKVSIIIAVKDIFLSMASRPALLASFVYELVLNQLSVDSIQFIVDRVDFRLPGEDSKLWRSMMLGNIPSAVYCSESALRFRGPQLITHRFMWGKYVSARFTQSSRGDVRIEVNPPIDGQFWIHAYDGAAIMVDITLDELRTFVKVVSQDADVVSARFVGNLDLLHPFFRGELFNLLLDSLTLDYEWTSDAPIKVDNSMEKQLGLAELSVDSSTLVWADDFKGRMLLCIRRFNAWSTRTVGKIPNLDGNSLTEARAVMDGLMRRPQWWLEVHKHNKSKNFVDIFQGLWIERHAESFYEKDVANAFQTLSHRYYEDRKMLTRGHDSFWRVRILTDDAKRRLYIKMRPSDMTDVDVQLALQQNERDDMAAEDEWSSRINVDEQVVLHHKRSAFDLSARQNKVTAMIKMLRLEKLKADRFCDMARVARQQLESQVNSIFAEIGQAAFNAAREAVPLGPDETMPLREEDVLERIAAMYPLVSCRDDAMKAKEIPPTTLDFVKPPKGVLDWLHIIEGVQSSLLRCSYTAFEIYCLKIEKAAPVPVLQKNPRRQELASTATVYDLNKYQPTIMGINRMTYRRSNSWKRYKPHRLDFSHTTPNLEVDKVAERAIRTAHRATSHNSIPLQLDHRYCIVGNPTVGPFDLVSFQIYEPLTKRMWTQTVAGTPNLPYLEASKPPLVQSAVVSSSGQLDKTTATMARLCAERVSCVSLMLGTAKAAEKLTETRMRRRLETIQFKVHEETKELVKLKIDMRMSLDESRFPSQFYVTKIGKANVHEIDIPVCAVFMPADDEIMPVPLRISAYDWPRVQQEYMQVEQGDMERTQAVPCIFTTYKDIPRGSNSDENARVMDWMSEYVGNMGWREGEERDMIATRFKREVKNKFSVAHLDVTGDCMLFFRDGEKDLHQLLDWSDAREAILGPIREAGRERMRTQKKRRFDNHAFFRDKVFRLAAKYRPHLEQLFHFRHQLRHQDKFAQDRTRPIHARALLLDFSEQLTRLETDPTIQDAFLIDQQMGLDDERIAPRFDGDEFERFRGLWAAPPAVPPPRNAGWAELSCVANPPRPLRDTLFDWSVADDFEPRPLLDVVHHPLDPGRSQVLYAMYLMHCRECTCKRKFCKVPGCESIREQVRDMTEERELNGEKADMSDLWDTGRHPVECAVRHFLVYGSNFPANVQVLPDAGCVSLGPDPYTWDVERKAAAEAARQTQKLNEYLRINYRTADKHALQFRYAERRLLRPHMKEVMRVQELIEMTGGKGYLDEQRMDTVVDPATNDVCTMLPAGVNETTSQALKVMEAEDTKVDKRELIFELKMTLIRAIIGSGTDYAGNVLVPYWSIDPYPMQKDALTDMKVAEDTGELYPMSHHMFKWISSRLHIAPVEKAYAAKPREEHYALQFNRKYNEEVIFLDDGSLVVIMVLFGVVPEGRLRSDLINGCPSAANQYCAINAVNDLIPGLTISIYDIRSDVSKAIKLFDKGLARFADVIEVDSSDLPKISERFIQLAHILVRLDRVGKLCTAVTIDPSGLNKHETSYPRTNDNYYDENDRRAAGARQVTTCARKGRLALAKEMRRKKSMM